MPEIKWVGLSEKNNTWFPLAKLQELGFSKLVQAFDDKIAGREGLSGFNVKVCPISFSLLSCYRNLRKIPSKRILRILDWNRSFQLTGKFEDCLVGKRLSVSSLPRHGPTPI